MPVGTAHGGSNNRLFQRADPKPWQAAVGATKAEAIVARLMAFLASKCSLFPRLAHMLRSACPLSLDQQQQQPQQAMSIPETLASNLVVRFLSLQKYPEVAAAQASLPRLLCVPLLWHRCPRVLFNVRSYTKPHCMSIEHCLATQLNARSMDCYTVWTAMMASCWICLCSSLTQEYCVRAWQQCPALMCVTDCQGTVLALLKHE